MKNKLLFLLISNFGLWPAQAQFQLLTPPVTIAVVEDIKTDGSKVFFATNNGILILDNNQNWQHINKSHGMAELSVKSLSPYPGGLLYSTVNKRIGSCNFSNVSEFTFNETPNINSYMGAIYINGTDTIYGGDNGLVYIARQGLRYDIDAAAIGGTSFGALVSINQIHSSYPPIDKNYVIVSRDKGFIFDLTNNTFQTLIETTGGVASNNMFCNSIDGSKSYIGTDKGLSWIDFDDLPSINILTIKRTNSGILSDTITAVVAKNDNLYIGTPKGLSVKINGNWKNFTTANSNLPNSEIVELALSGNDLFIATKDGKICKIGMNEMTSVANVAYDINFSVYPNPAINQITIQKSTYTQGIYSIWDYSGRRVLEQAGTDVKTNIDISNLSPGFYSIQFATDEYDYMMHANFIKI